MLMQRALLVSSVSLAASFSSIPERTLRSPATYTRGNLWSWAATDESQVVERKSCPPKEPLVECISKSLLPLRIDCIVECALFDVGCVTTCVAHIVHIVDCILECEIKPEASPPPLPALPPQSPAPPATPPSPAMSPNAPAAPYTCLGYNEGGEPFEPYCDKKHQSLAKECPTICFRGADPSVHLAARVERVKAHHCKKDPWKGKYPLVLMPDSWGGQLGEYKLFDLTGGIFNLLPEFLLNQIMPYGVDWRVSFSQNCYVVVEFQPRGWFDSSGVIGFSQYDKDGGDIRAIIDHVTSDAFVEEYQVDVEKISMVGISYGAGLSLLGASVDPRVKVAASLNGWGNFGDALAGPSLMSAHMAATELLLKTPLSGNHGRYSNMAAANLNTLVNRINESAWSTGPLSYGPERVSAWANASSPLDWTDGETSALESLCANGARKPYPGNLAGAAALFILSDSQDIIFQGNMELRLRQRAIDGGCPTYFMFNQGPHAISSLANDRVFEQVLRWLDMNLFGNQGWHYDGGGQTVAPGDLYFQPVNSKYQDGELLLNLGSLLPLNFMQHYFLMGDDYLPPVKTWPPPTTSLVLADGQRLASRSDCGAKLCTPAVIEWQSENDHAFCASDICLASNADQYKDDYRTKMMLPTMGLQGHTPFGSAPDFKPSAVASLAEDKRAAVFQTLPGDLGGESVHICGTVSADLLIETPSNGSGTFQVVAYLYRVKAAWLHDQTRKAKYQSYGVFSEWNGSTVATQSTVTIDINLACFEVAADEGLAVAFTVYDPFYDPRVFTNGPMPSGIAPDDGEWVRCNCFEPEPNVIDPFERPTFGSETCLPEKDAPAAPCPGPFGAASTTNPQQPLSYGTSIKILGGNVTVPILTYNTKSYAPPDPGLDRYSGPNGYQPCFKPYCKEAAAFAEVAPALARRTLFSSTPSEDIECSPGCEPV